MDEIFDDADYLPKILFSGPPAPVPVTEIEIFEFVAGRPPDGYVFGRDAGVPVKSGQSAGHDLQNDVPVFEFVENSPQAGSWRRGSREKRYSSPGTKWKSWIAIAAVGRFYSCSTRSSSRQLVSTRM